MTFSDYRRYVPGDDTHLIDRKLYARTEEYYVKQYEEERSLDAHVDLIRDLNLSMGAEHEVLSTGDDLFDSFESVGIG